SYLPGRLIGVSPDHLQHRPGRTPPVHGSLRSLDEQACLPRTTANQSSFSVTMPPLPCSPAAAYSDVLVHSHSPRMLRRPTASRTLHACSHSSDQHSRLNL